MLDLFTKICYLIVIQEAKGVKRSQHEQVNNVKKISQGYGILCRLCRNGEASL